MAFDSLTLKILTQEFQNSIIGGKINKIYQPEKDEVVLCIYNKVSYKLLLSANAGINRIHFTEYAPENPLVAPNFCMLLRKHLLNATILSINQQPYERVIDFLLENKNELGYTENKHLIFELTGKTSNIILTSEEYTILDTVKHLPQDINSDRLMYNGAKYAFFAPQNKISPFNYKGIANLLSTTCLPIRQLLVDNLLGVSTQTVNEMMSGIDENLHNDLNTKRILDSIHIVENNFNTPRPNVVYKDSEPIDVCPFEMTRVKGDKEFYPLLNTAHDKYFYLKDKQQRFKDKAKTVSTIVKNAISRTEKKIAIQLQGALDAGE
ncbi:MAG: NFACT family protein, partial [Clostridia bacterium]